MAKKVLVIVPTHSREHTLEYTVKSILNQTYTDFNLAIIGDGVSESYKKIIQKIVELDKRIYFYDNPKSERTGEPYRNEVIKKFNPKYITYCGDDDLFISNHISTMVDEIRGYDFVHPLAYWIIHKSNDATFFDRFLDNKESLDWFLKGNNFISLTGAMHTKEIFNKTEGWTTTPKGFSTDRYMWGKFFDIDGFKPRSSRKCTTIKISYSTLKAKNNITPEDELSLIKHWFNVISNKAFIKQWEAYIKNTVLPSSKYLNKP